MLDRLLPARLSDGLTTTPPAIEIAAKYVAKLSGRLLGRIDLHT
jgi:hypothetical protein